MYLGTVMFAIHLVFSTIARLPVVWRLILLRRKAVSGGLTMREYYETVHAKARNWARAQLKWAGARVDVKGLENIKSIDKSRAIVFAGNHQSDFDVIIYLSYLDEPIGFVAKESTLKIPVAGKAMKCMGCVFMNRDDARQSVKTILEGVEIVKSGHSMVIFPEGTRRRNNPTGEFKSGAMKLASKAGAMLVPVTIDGSENIFELAGGHIKRADVTVTFHKPIDTAVLSREEQSALNDTVRSIVVGALKDMR